MAHHPPPSTPTIPGDWSLAVVRGRDLGRAYALGLGETILGNALNGEAGLDLSDQEGRSPRRMAPRQAAVRLEGADLTIQDLDTPGGTFVNRQRLLSGQSRRLQPGDVIQLGGVQLRVEGRPDPPRVQAVVRPAGTGPGPASGPVAFRNPDKDPPPAPTTTPQPTVTGAGGRAGAPPPSSPGRLPVPFALPGGPSCRTWDDFLVLAAQRWNALRDELGSGRLAEFLRGIQRLELVPRPEKGRSLDEQLDAWLARLPVTVSSAPELDVHPEVLTVRAVGGGGVTRQFLRISNVGYRLLRCTARIEPPGTRWIRLRPEHNGHPFATIEQTDLPVEIELPEVRDASLSAAIILESNGGTRRVAVRVERPAEPEFAIAPPSIGTGATERSSWVPDLVRRLAQLRPGARVRIAILGAVALRALVVLSGLVPLGGPSAAIVEPRLPAMAVVLAGGGAVLGGWLGRRKGDRLDLLSAGFAGGAFALLTAAVLYAVIRSIEHLLGSWSSSLGAVALLWAATGTVIAGASLLWIPYRPDNAEAAP